MSIHCIDLFCGAGGLSKGLLDSGVNVICGFDKWEPSLKTYNQNLSNTGIRMDLDDVESAIEYIYKNVGKPDMIVGGPPCQLYTNLGVVRQKDGTFKKITKTMIFAFQKIIDRIAPDFFLLENVLPFSRSKDYKIVNKLFDESGYHMAEFKIDASYYDVPQMRKRFFVFGSRKIEIANKLAQYIYIYMNSNQLTVKEYLKEEIDVDFYFRYINANNISARKVFSVHEPAPTVLSNNANPLDRPKRERFKHHLDPVHPLETRKLTHYQRSRIQTFPKDWDWCMTDRNKQVANAVPVVVAQRIGESLLKSLG